MKVKDLIYVLRCGTRLAKNRKCNSCTHRDSCISIGKEFENNDSNTIIAEQLENLLNHLNAANMKLKQAESDAKYWQHQYKNLYHLIKIASVAGDETMGVNND